MACSVRFECGSEPGNESQKVKDRGPEADRQKSRLWLIRLLLSQLVVGPTRTQGMEGGVVGGAWGI